MQTHLAFIGPKQCGKDTAFGLTHKILGYGVKVSFATALKDVIAAVFNIPRSQFDDTQGKEDRYCWPEILTPEKLNLVINCYKKLGLNTRPDNLIRPVVDLTNTLVYSNRQLMQLIGTELLRRCDSEVHVTVLERSIAALTDLVCFTDIRFDNELELAKSKGATLIYIERPSAEKAVYESSHESEKSFVKYREQAKYLLQNHGTIAEMEIVLKEILKLEGLTNGK